MYACEQYEHWGPTDLQLTSLFRGYDGHNCHDDPTALTVQQHVVRLIR